MAPIDSSTSPCLARAAGLTTIRPRSNSCFPVAEGGSRSSQARKPACVKTSSERKLASTFAIGAGVVSQLPVLATEVFGWGDGGTGLLLGARGLGAGLGPIIASRFARGELSRVLRICGYASMLFSVLYLSAAWMPKLLLAVVVISIAHLGGGSQWTLSTYGLQLRTPDHIRGRVMAGDFAIVTLVMTLSGLGAGALSSAAGVRPTIITFSLVGGVAGFAYLRYTKPIIARLRAAEDSSAT